MSSYGSDKGEIMQLLQALVITMTVTVYAPEAGGINGSGVMADGTRPFIGHAACGYRYPFGTVFELPNEVSDFGLPNVVECRDRGGSIGNRNLDVVMSTGYVKLDLFLAFHWGKRKVPVRVWKDWDAYHSSVALGQTRESRTPRITPDSKFSKRLTSSIRT